jgi:hypothetical protein
VAIEEETKEIELGKLLKTEEFWMLLMTELLGIMAEELVAKDTEEELSKTVELLEFVKEEKLLRLVAGLL